MRKIVLIFALLILPNAFLLAADSLQIAKKIVELKIAKDTHRLRLLDEISWLSRRLNDIIQRFMKR